MQTTVLDRGNCLSRGIYPAVDPLASTSQTSGATFFLGDETLLGGQRISGKFFSVIEICRILLLFLVWKNFQMKIKVVVNRGQKNTEVFYLNPFSVAEQFLPVLKGKICFTKEDTVKRFLKK